jgi:hypothetical protein
MNINYTLVIYSGFSALFTPVFLLKVITSSNFYLTYFTENETTCPRITVHFRFRVN